MRPLKLAPCVPLNRLKLRRLSRYAGWSRGGSPRHPSGGRRGMTDESAFNKLDDRGRCPRFRRPDAGRRHRRGTRGRPISLVSWSLLGRSPRSLQLAFHQMSRMASPAACSTSLGLCTAGIRGGDRYPVPIIEAEDGIASPDPTLRTLGSSTAVGKASIVARRSRVARRRVDRASKNRLTQLVASAE